MGGTELGHTGQRSDSLGQGVPGISAPRGPAALPRPSKDVTKLLLQQEVPPLATGSEQWAAGGEAWGPHPLTCRTRAAVSTQQAAQQMEKPRSSRILLPKSSTTNTWRGGPGKAGAQEP